MTNADRPARGNPPTLSRRKVLGGLAAACAPLIIPSRLLGKDAPSNKITLGFIGMGLQGTGRNLGTFKNQPDAVILTVCDVHKARARKAKAIVDKHHGNADCVACQDFREILQRDDLDAIVISTPDHWHVPLSMAALAAGKDVFCEKPSLTITEGRTLVGEVRKRKAVFQWGIEDRSLIKYHRMAGWVRSGAIGTLKSIHVTLPQKPSLPLEEAVPVPADLDWNLWLGPAPFHPYTPNRMAPQSWRSILDYSGGAITDWGAHLVDTAQVGARMDHSGPVEVSGTGSIPDPKKFHTNVPMNFDLHYRYANGVEMFVTDGQVDIKFVGTDGWVRCAGWNGAWSASDRDILRIQEFPKEADFWPRPPIEHRDFLDSVKSRGNPAYHVEAGHRLSTTLHLGHLAVRSGRKITWNPDEEAFAAGDAESARSPLYQRPSRDWAAV
jgi:predicted dehydrogenase